METCEKCRVCQFNGLPKPLQTLWPAEPYFSVLTSRGLVIQLGAESVRTYLAEMRIDQRQGTLNGVVGLWRATWSVTLFFGKDWMQRVNDRTLSSSERSIAEKSHRWTQNRLYSHRSYLNQMTRSQRKSSNRCSNQRSEKGCRKLMTPRI